MKIGIVISRFNNEVTELLEKGALDYLDQLEGEVELFSVRVPTAVEISLACQALLDEGCEGVIALGSVIRGETLQSEYICQSVERGITNLILQRQKPIGFGVLMTETEEQAMDRAGGSKGNLGAEAAQIVVEMVGLLADIKAVGAENQKTLKKQAAKKSKTKKKTKSKKLKK